MAAVRSLQRSATVDPSTLEAWLSKGKERSIQAEELQAGTWPARENAQVAVRMTERPLFPERSLTWGSCCSGSEGVRFCFEALNVVAAELGYKTSFRHIFSCESNDEKKNWIQMVNRCAPACMASIKSALDGVSCPAPASQDQPCLFTDIGRLGQAYAPCAIHAHGKRVDPERVSDRSARASEKGTRVSNRGSETRVSDHGESRVSDRAGCGVRQVDILVLGTSCKDMSRANPSYKVGGPPVLLSESSKGGSAQTFHGMLAYVESHAPQLVIFENVDTMDDKSDVNSNLDILLAEMGNRGYESQVIMSDAAMMGLPARRRRSWGVFSKKVNFGRI